MAVRIRMKQMGRAHRPYYRIVAVDSHSPQFGRVLEELGTYDPAVPETDARVTLKMNALLTGCLLALFRPKRLAFLSRNTVPMEPILKLKKQPLNDLPKSALA